MNPWHIILHPKVLNVYTEFKIKYICIIIIKFVIVFIGVIKLLKYLLIDHVTDRQQDTYVQTQSKDEYSTDTKMAHCMNQ